MLIYRGIWWIVKGRAKRSLTIGGQGVFLGVINFYIVLIISFLCLLVKKCIKIFNNV